MVNRRVEYTGPAFFELDAQGNRNPLPGATLPLPEGMALDSLKDWPVISVDAELAEHLVRTKGSEWRYATAERTAAPERRGED